MILNSKIEGLADSCIRWVIGSHQGNHFILIGKTYSEVNEFELHSDPVVIVNDEGTEFKISLLIAMEDLVSSANFVLKTNEQGAVLSMKKEF